VVGQALRSLGHINGNATMRDVGASMVAAAKTQPLPAPPAPSVRRWTQRDLASMFGVCRATIRRAFLPELERAGLLRRHGRSWYGRAADLEAWLSGTSQRLGGEA
jgi:CRP-like cAMP-binding protein